MARGEVFLVMPDSDYPQLWRTDLKGHGGIAIGTEFTVRELWQFGRGQLVKGGRKLVVRVLGEHSRLIVKDLSPEEVTSKGLFD